MKDLKGFSNYLRTNCLRELAIEYLRIIKSLDIPLVKLVIERNLYPELTEEKSIEMSMAGLDKFLVSIDKETLFEDAKQGLKRWEEDKIPGISKHDVRPSDLVLIYAAQKRALFKFLPSYTPLADEIITITTELEDCYMKMQNDAIEILFKIQKETEESMQRLIDILEATHDFVGFADAKDRHILYINSAGRKMTGLGSTVDVTTLKIDDVHPEWTNKLFRDEVFPIVIRDGIWNGECAFINQEGREIPVSMVLLAHKAPNGEVVRFSTISRDITEIKKNKEELVNKAIELARSNTELEQFAYVASHDLQEPLRTVSSYVQLLAARYKDKLDTDANEFIDFAIDGSNRMRQLINSLLEYSRINRLKPFEPINTKDLITSLLMDISDTVKSADATIKYDNLPDIYGDHVLISQLFQNLIGNALKFRSEKKPEIIISCEKRNGQYLFSVQDNGIGMQKEYWDKIFIIFQRLNSREKYQGTGIGLSICKKIVERHGGKIWVESEPGKGSTFYFTINIYPDTQLPNIVKEDAKRSKHIAN